MIRKNWIFVIDVVDIESFVIIDVQNYNLRPRQRVQIFESDSDNDFQAGPSTRKVHNKKRPKKSSFNLQKDEGWESDEVETGSNGEHFSF